MKKNKVLFIFLEFFFPVKMASILPVTIINDFLSSKILNMHVVILSKLLVVRFSYLSALPLFAIFSDQVCAHNTVRCMVTQ